MYFFEPHIPFENSDIPQKEPNLSLFYLLHWEILVYSNPLILHLENESPESEVNCPRQGWD